MCGAVHRTLGLELLLFEVLRAADEILLLFDNVCTVTAGTISAHLARNDQLNLGCAFPKPNSSVGGDGGTVLIGALCLPQQHLHVAVRQLRGAMFLKLYCRDAVSISSLSWHIAGVQLLK